MPAFEYSRILASGLFETPGLFLIGGLPGFCFCRGGHVCPPVNSCRNNVISVNMSTQEKEVLQVIFLPGAMVARLPVAH